MNNKPIFIAEVKIKSPFGFNKKDEWNYRFDLARNYGDWISIHTNHLWGGDISNIKLARENTDKPILAKGFHKTDKEIRQCLDAGANYVLIVDRIPERKYIDNCLLEFSEFKELQKAANIYPWAKFVWNARDLKTGKLKSSSILGKVINHFTLFDIYREINKNIWLCQASGILNKQQVNPLANAFLVGENLPQFIRS